jgi:hypothetical protein
MRHRPDIEVGSQQPRVSGGHIRHRDADAERPRDLNRDSNVVYLNSERQTQVERRTLEVITSRDFRVKMNEDCALVDFEPNVLAVVPNYRRSLAGRTRAVFSA